MTTELFDEIINLLEKKKFSLSFFSSPTERTYHDLYGTEVYVDKDWGVSILNEITEQQKVFSESEIEINKVEKALKLLT